eukprot:1615349-Rhodomonas_salina.1
MIKAFRGEEWGNADCIRHTARLLRKGIVVFTQGSTQNYYSWETDPEPDSTLILYNSTCPATGKLVHFNPCRHRTDPTDEFNRMLAEKKAGLNRAIAGGELEMSYNDQVAGTQSERRPDAGGGVLDEECMLVLLSDYSMTTVSRQNQNREQEPTQLSQNSEPLRSTPTVKEKRQTTRKIAMDSSQRRRNRTQTAATHSTNQGVRNRENRGNGEESVDKFRPDRLIFREKKQQQQSQPARSHWGLYYFMFQMQSKQRSTWDLSSLSQMALHPKISRSAAASIWEIGWQEMTDDEQMPDVTVGFDHMDTEN